MGVTYYKLQERYEGDRTKGCGLTTAEMDENFHFLRGYDIKDAYFENGLLTLERVNCDKIIVEGIPEYIRSIADETMEGFECEISLSGTTYNENTGVLTIMVNGEPYTISGFLTPDYDFKLYVGYGLDGRGTIANPLRVSHVNDTGFLAPVDSIIGEGESLPDSNVSGSRRYLTKEKKSPYGLLYSAEDALKIDEWLQENARGLRLPTIDEWNEMLNALECSDNDRNHDKRNATDGEELGAAAARYLKAEEFNDEPELNSFNALPIMWEAGTLIAGFWSRTPSGDLSLQAKELHKGEDKVTHLNATNNHTRLKAIRLVKDVEYNSYEDEEIGGITYKTVPMAAYKDGGIYATKLWLAENLRLDIVDGVEGIEPKGRGYYLENDEAFNKTTSDVYVVNMWDPFDKKWVKRELKENDVVIVNDYENGEPEEVIVHIDENGNQVLVPHFQDIRDAIKDINDRLDVETENRTAADEALDSKIDNLSTNTQNTIAELSAGTDERINRLTEETARAITALTEDTNNKINQLSEDTENKISQLSEDTENHISELSDEITDLITNLAQTTAQKIEDLSNATTGKTSEIESNVQGLSGTTEVIEQNVENISNELDTIKTKAVDENDKFISLDENGVISSSFRVVYDPGNKVINFFGKNTDEPFYTIPTEEFVMDGMVESAHVGIPTNGINAGVECLIITFNIAGKEGYNKQDIEIPLTSFARVYQEGDFIRIDRDYKINVVTGSTGLATGWYVDFVQSGLTSKIENLDDKIDDLKDIVGVGYTGETITHKIDELREDIAYELNDIEERVNHLEEEGSVIKTLVGDGDIEVSEPDASGMTHISLLHISNPEPIPLDMKRDVFINFGTNNENNIELHDYWEPEYTFTVPPTPQEGQRWFIDTNDNYGVDTGEIVLPVGGEYTINLEGKGQTAIFVVRLFNATT